MIRTRGFPYSKMPIDKMGLNKQLLKLQWDKELVIKEIAQLLVRRQELKNKLSELESKIAYEITKTII